MSDVDKSTLNRTLMPRLIAANLLGNGLPLLIAFACVPPLLAKFGSDRFGYISLFWALIGTFSIADLGLSRAATHYVARHHAVLRTPQYAADIWALILLTTALGGFGSAVVFWLGHFYVDTAASSNLQVALELKASLPWLAAAVPFTTGSAACRGVLEGELHFTYINVVKVLGGALGFIGLFFSEVLGDGLEGAAAILFAVRAAMAVSYVLPVAARIPPTWKKVMATQLGTLLTFGGWVTVSNVVGTLLVYLDRLLLGAVLIPSALTIYATSFESASRLLFIAGSVSTVLYPIAAGNDRVSIAALVRAANVMLLVLFALPCLLLVFVADYFLAWWIDPAFAEVATPVFRIICIAVILNGFAHVPFAVIQGLGRPDITAKIQLLEIAPYVLVLGTFAMAWGTTGAALAWLLRVLVDYVLLLRYQLQMTRDRDR